MITVTNSAKDQIFHLLKEEEPGTYLRTFVQGGGCSGFQYGFTFDNQIDDDDFLIDVEKFKLVVDAMSMQYLDGAEIDYRLELEGSNFVINNPNAVSTCGCGSSFTV
jgi:iron-sulfur cluster insertion protein